MRRGTALVEYVAVIVAVGALILALLALRPHQPARTPPLRPVDRLGDLVAPPPAPPRVQPAASGRARPVRPRPPRPSVLVPGWAIGW